jgi:hypothetical protein
MAIVNRTKDASEQRIVLKQSYGAIATGTTNVIAIIPHAGVLEGIQMAAVGLSGSPTHAVHLHRFIVGTGFTGWAVTGAEAPAAFGTSGVLARGMSMLASGSTLLNVLPNDCLVFLPGGTNSGCASSSFSAVVKPIQDIKTFFGISGL